MSLISSLIGQVRRTAHAISGSSFAHSLFGMREVKVKYSDSGFGDSVTRIFEAVNTGKLLDSTAGIIGDRALFLMKQEADKFSRTGALRDSLYLQRVGDGRFIIDSDLPYKSTWLSTDNQGAPSVQSLLPWMAQKPEFSGLSQQESTRIAYAIRQSVKTGAGAGSTGRSTLRSLSPTGERAYDFVRAAIKQMEPELKDLHVIFKEI